MMYILWQSGIRPLEMTQHAKLTSEYDKITVLMQNLADLAANIRSRISLFNCIIGVFKTSSWLG